MPSKFNTISFQGQTIYIGIDAHLKSWKITVMLDHMEYKTFSQDANADILLGYLNRNFPGGEYCSAYEAGFCGFIVHRELEWNGIKNIVVNPADIPTTDKDRKQKEDKRDSRKIAKSLRNGELEGIYVPSYEMEELRSLVRYRKILIIYRFDVILKNTQNSVIRIPAMLVKYLPGNTLRNPEII